MKAWLLVVSGVALLACSAKAKHGAAEQNSGEATQVDDASQEKVAPIVGWKAKLGEIDKLVYHFQDSSVPPQYHRSVTLTASAQEVEKVVDSYGDIISTEATATTEDAFRGLLATMEGLGIDQVSASKDKGPSCTGGTSDSLKLYSGGTLLLEGRVSSCGGEKNGTLKGDVKQLARNAEALILPSTDASAEP